MTYTTRSSGQNLISVRTFFSSASLPSRDCYGLQQEAPQNVLDNFLERKSVRLDL
jgi:hypothetical protein